LSKQFPFSGCVALHSAQKFSYYRQDLLFFHLFIFKKIFFITNIKKTPEFLLFLQKIFIFETFIKTDLYFKFYRNLGPFITIYHPQRHTHHLLNKLWPS